MTDFRNDARIAATLLREMKEELFGREDIDSTVAEQYAADPTHSARLSEPMRWLLMENPRRLARDHIGGVPAKWSNVRHSTALRKFAVCALGASPGICFPYRPRLRVHIQVCHLLGSGRQVPGSNPRRGYGRRFV